MNKFFKNLIFKNENKKEDRKKGGYVQDGRRKGEGDNPYLSSRRTWKTLIDWNEFSKRMWQMAALGSFMVILLCVIGIIRIGSQSKFTPYVIEVDKHGISRSVGVISRTVKSDPRILKSVVAQFISDARLVTPDIALQRKAIFRVYAHLSSNDPAIKKMNEWLNGDVNSNPFERAKKLMVNIEIRSVLPQTEETWQVNWIETIRDRNGNIVESPETYRGIFTMYFAEVGTGKTEEHMRMNPLGIYVKNYSWQKLL